MYTQHTSASVADTPLSTAPMTAVPMAISYLPPSETLSSQTLTRSASPKPSSTKSSAAAPPLSVPGAADTDELMAALSKVPYLHAMTLSAPQLVYQPPTVLQLRNAGAMNVVALTEAYSGLPTLHVQMEVGPYASPFSPPYPSSEYARLESLWPPEPIDWDAVASELHHAGARQPSREDGLQEEAFWRRVGVSRQRERDQGEKATRAKRHLARRQTLGRASLSSVGGSTALARGAPSVFESAVNTPMSRQPSLTASAHTPIEAGVAEASLSAVHRRRTSLSPSLSTVTGATTGASGEAANMTPAQRTAKGLLRRARVNGVTAARAKPSATTTPTAPAAANTSGFRFPILSVRSLGSTTNASAYPEHSVFSLANSSEFASVMTPNTARTGVTEGWYSPMTATNAIADPPMPAPPAVPRRLPKQSTSKVPAAQSTRSNAAAPAPMGAAPSSPAAALPAVSASTTASATASPAGPARSVELVTTALAVPSADRRAPESPQLTRAPSSSSSPSVAAKPLRPPGRASIELQKRRSSATSEGGSRTSSRPARRGDSAVSSSPSTVAPPAASALTTTPTPAPTTTLAHAAATDKPLPATDNNGHTSKSSSTRVARIRLPPLAIPTNTHEQIQPTASPAPASGLNGQEKLTPLKPSTSYYSDGSAHRVAMSSRSLKASASTMVLAPEPLPTGTTDSGSRGTTNRSQMTATHRGRTSTDGATPPPPPLPQPPPTRGPARQLIGALSPASSASSHLDAVASRRSARPRGPQKAAQPSDDRRDVAYASGAAASDSDDSLTTRRVDGAPVAAAAPHAAIVSRAQARWTAAPAARHQPPPPTSELVVRKHRPSTHGEQTASVTARTNDPEAARRPAVAPRSTTAEPRVPAAPHAVTTPTGPRLSEASATAVPPSAALGRADVHSAVSGDAPPAGWPSAARSADLVPRITDATQSLSPRSTPLSGADGEPTTSARAAPTPAVTQETAPTEPTNGTAAPHAAVAAMPDGQSPDLNKTQKREATSGTRPQKKKASQSQRKSKEEKTSCCTLM